MSIIYFILTEDRKFVKIGTTVATVKARLDFLQTGNHQKLFVLDTIPGDIYLEHFIHDQLKEYQIRSEWFSYTSEVELFLKRFVPPGNKSLCLSYGKDKKYKTTVVTKNQLAWVEELESKWSKVSQHPSDPTGTSVRCEHPTKPLSKKENT